MQLGCGSTTYTQTYTFQHVPTHKIVNRTKVKLAQVYISCWSGCHKLRRNCIHRRNGTRQLRHGSHFLHQLIYRILIFGQWLWTKRVPSCSTIVHRHGVIRLYLVRCHTREDVLRNRTLQIPMGVNLRLTSYHTLLLVEDIKLSISRRPIGCPKTVLQLNIVMLYRVVARKVKIDLWRDIDGITLDTIRRVVHYI